MLYVTIRLKIILLREKSKIEVPRDVRNSKGP